MRVMTILSAAGIILIQSAAWALIDPIALSGVQTVSPSGFADVGRNPALLPFNRESVSIGIAGMFTPVENYSGKLATKKGQTADISADIDSKNPLIISQDAGFMVRTANAGFGFSSSSSGDSTYENKKVKTQLLETITSAATALTQKTEEKTKTLNPGGSFSWGYRTSDSFSWGIGIQGGYKTSESSSFSSRSGVNNAVALTDSIKEKTTSKEYRGKLSLGFLYRMENIEAGLLITSGDMTLGSAKYSYIYDSTTTTLSGPTIADKASVTQPFTTGPPSIILGFRIMTSYFDFVGEAGTLSSESRTIKSVSYDQDSSSLTRSSKEYQTGVNAVFRGGIIFHPGSVFKMILGGGYIAKAEKTNEPGNGASSSSDTETFSQTFLASGGIELALGSHLTLGVTGLYGHLYAKGSANFNSIQSTIRSNADIMQVSAGAALSF